MRRLAEVLDEARNIGLFIGTFVDREHPDMPIEEINALGIQIRAAIEAKEAEYTEEENR
ncbi:MAG: hypothetical protein ABIH46_11035 [Chloroflexota bacterium]